MVEKFADQPHLLLSTTIDAFQKPLEVDELLRGLQLTECVGSFQQTLQLAISAIHTVTTRQLSRYISGELSLLTPELLEASKSASPHNVWAERVLGMWNAIHDRTTQASSAYIESKIQCATNDTLGWLDTHCLKEQEKIVNFAVIMARKLREEEKRRKRWLIVEAERRLVNAAEKKDEKARKDQEKEIAAVARDQGLGGMECFEGFNQLQDYQKERVQDILDRKSLKDVRFSHKWDEDGVTETWQAIIVGHGKRKSGLLSYKVRYWLELEGIQEQVEEDDGYYSIFAEKLLCDLFLGDLKFI